jgi:hypothetical protein
MPRGEQAKASMGRERCAPTRHLCAEASLPSGLSRCAQSSRFAESRRPLSAVPRDLATEVLLLIDVARFCGVSLMHVNQSSATSPASTLSEAPGSPNPFPSAYQRPTAGASWLREPRARDFPCCRHRPSPEAALFGYRTLSRPHASSAVPGSGRLVRQWW